MAPAIIIRIIAKIRPLYLVDTTSLFFTTTTNDAFAVLLLLSLAGRNHCSSSDWKYLTRSHGLAYRMYICGHIIGYRYRIGIVDLLPFALVALATIRL